MRLSIGDYPIEGYPVESRSSGTISYRRRSYEAGHMGGCPKGAFHMEACPVEEWVEREVAENMLCLTLC